jgi:hypothetical protein
MNKNPDYSVNTDTRDNPDTSLQFVRRLAPMCRDTSAGSPVEFPGGADLWIEDSFDADEGPNELTRVRIISFWFPNPTVPGVDNRPWPITVAGPVNPGAYEDMAVEFPDGVVNEMRNGRRYRSVAEWISDVRQRRQEEKRCARSTRASARKQNG